MTTWEDLAVGFAPDPRTDNPLKVSDFVRYQGASGDFNPIHHDPEFAAKAGFQCQVSGYAPLPGPADKDVVEMACSNRPDGAIGIFGASENDPATIIDKATFVNPAQLSEGIAYTIVNGQIEYDHGKLTGATAGKILRGRGWQPDVH